MYLGEPIKNYFLCNVREPSTDSSILRRNTCGYPLTAINSYVPACFFCARFFLYIKLINLSGIPETTCSGYGLFSPVASYTFVESNHLLLVSEIFPNGL